MFEGKTTEELRRERRELTAQRDNSTDAAVKKRLAGEIQAISDEITNRSLDASRDAQSRVKGLEQDLDRERTATPTDAVSAAVRGTRRIADEVRRRTDRGSGSGGNG